MARRPSHPKKHYDPKPEKQPKNVPKGMSRMKNPFTKPQPNKRIAY